MTTTVEYNKIHALARARKLIVDKFGSNLLNFWPMADDAQQVRDLLRQRALLATSAVTLQQAGLLDYALKPGDGYLADCSPNVGALGYDDYGNQWGLALVPIPEGVYDSIEMVGYSDTAQNLKDNLKLYITPQSSGQLNWDDRVAECLDPEVELITGAFWKMTWRFATPFFAAADQYRFGAHFVSTYYARAGRHSATDQGVGYWTQWSAGNFASLGDYAPVHFVGRPAQSWPATDKLFVGISANVEAASPGVLVALSSNSEAKVQLEVESNYKILGTIKNAGGTLYTVESPDKLHSGFNVLTLSYEPSVAVKLGLNGRVVLASTTPSSSGALASGALAIGVGAKVLTTGAASLKVKNALIDDVWLAKSVLSDSDLWNIYMAYIITVPMMQVEDVTRI